MSTSSIELPILPTSELRLVLALRRLHEATAPQLARSVQSGLTPNTAQRLLHRLEEKGLVKGRKADTSRLWALADSSILPALLEAEARHLLDSRYGCDPMALKALLDEIKRILDRQ